VEAAIEQPQDTHPSRSQSSLESLLEQLSSRDGQLKIQRMKVLKPCANIGARNRLTHFPPRFTRLGLKHARIRFQFRFEYPHIDKFNMELSALVGSITIPLDQARLPWPPNRAYIECVDRLREHWGPIIWGLFEMDHLSEADIKTDHNQDLYWGGLEDVTWKPFSGSLIHIPYSINLMTTTCTAGQTNGCHRLMAVFPCYLRSGPQASQSSSIHLPSRASQTAITIMTLSYTVL
jgi:hypothetical protein